LDLSRKKVDVCLLSQTPRSSRNSPRRPMSTACGWSAEDLADGLARVQRGVWVLEDELDIAPGAQPRDHRSLFVTLNRVESHLGRAYTKLDIQE
jgi:hypothetical protein